MLALFNKRHQPVSMTTKPRLYDQMGWSESVKSLVWQSIVRSKLKHESMLLSYLNLPSFTLLNFGVEITDSIEALAAKTTFYQLFGADFVRDRDLRDVNQILNYGYSLLAHYLTTEIVSHGYLPALGFSPQKVMADLAKQNQDISYRPQELALMTWALTYVQQRYLYQQLNLDYYEFEDDNVPSISEQSKATIENQLSKPAKIVDVPWGRDLYLQDNNNQKVDWRLFDRNVLFERGSSKAVDNQLKDDLKIVRDYYGIKSINLVEPSSVLMGIDFEELDVMQSPIHHVDMRVPFNRDSIFTMKRVMQQAEDGDND